MELRRGWQAVLGMAFAAGVGVVVPASASAATCDNLPDGWFTFNAPSRGKNWRVGEEEPGIPRVVRANGDPSVDPWNQWFIVCDPSDWPHGYFRIYSNVTKEWLWMTNGDYAHSVAADNPYRDDLSTLFCICDFDENFMLIRHPARALWVFHLPNEVPVGPVVVGHFQRPTGENLITSSPRLNDRVPDCDGS